jgi:hemoglobin/transferrin/lactoferrin receptor protein
MRNAIRPIVAITTLRLSTLLTTAMLSVAHAEEPKNFTSLDAVTVYATRSLQSTFDVPAIVSKIDVDAPGNALAGDVGDLLEFIPGVEVDNGPRRNGQTISIRGFDAESIITLMDGRRQNFESAHDGRLFIDTSLLKSVEIVKGVSSAIYGGGGVGGVIAFETKDASDLLAPGETSGALTSFGYRSANNEYSPTFTGYGRAGGWDFLGSVTYRDSGDVKQGDGNKLDTEDQVLSGLLKTGYTFNDFHTLKFQAQILNNDGQEPNNGAGAITSSNPIVDKEVQDNQFSLKYAFENPDNSWLNLKLHVYYNDTEVEEEDITGTRAGRVQVRKLNTLGFTADNQTKIVVNDSHNHTLSYGFEIYNDEQTGSSSTTGTRPGVPNAEATNYGLYLQDEVTFNTSVGDFLIIPAARFDKYKSNDENGNSQDENEFSPKLSLSYKPIESVMFFGSWARAFRAPNLTELYPTGLHFPGGGPVPDNNFVPNLNLKPEVVTTIELGAGLDFDNVLTSKDRAKVKGSWFTSDGENFITQQVNVFGGTTQNFNIPNAKLTGWEVEGQYQLHAVTAKFGLSYVEAENKDTGEYISNNVPLTLVADLGYQIDSVDSVIGWRGRFADANDKVGSTDTATHGYAVHDLYYRWTPGDKGMKSLTVDVGVDNVLGKAYAKRFTSLLEEGRSYGVKVSYKW